MEIDGFFSTEYEALNEEEERLCIEKASDILKFSDSQTVVAVLTITISVYRRLSDYLLGSKISIMECFTVYSRLDYDT